MNDIKIVEDNYSKYDWEDLSDDSVKTLYHHLSSILSAIKIGDGFFDTIKLKKPRFLDRAEEIENKRESLMTDIENKSLEKYQLKKVVKDIVSLYHQANDFILEFENREVGAKD